jgi:hypothetical protein
MTSTTTRWVWSVAAVAVIWVSSAAMAIWSPDLVTGSAQEHIPIIAMTVWFWALLATGLVVMAPSVGASSSGRTWSVYAGAVSVIWIIAGIVSIAAPPMVTGSDPTSIPIAGLTTAIVAMAATAYATVAVVAVASREQTIGNAVDEVVRRLAQPVGHSAG